MEKTVAQDLTGWLVLQIIIVRGVLPLLEKILVGVIVYFATRGGEQAVTAYMQAHGHIKETKRDLS